MNLLDIHICNDKVTFFLIYISLFYDKVTGDAKAFIKVGEFAKCLFALLSVLLYSLDLYYIVYCVLQLKKLLYKYIDLIVEAYQKVYHFSREEPFRVPLWISLAL